MTDPRGEDDAAAWTAAAKPSWASTIDVPDWLALRAGSRPIVVVAPHGGRRRRGVRRGDSVNDLHTAAIAWTLAERLDAHAIVNHGLDRNEIDLNRIAHVVERAPDVLALLAAAVEHGARDGEVPLVLFVHGWNMVVPCCDIGIGLRRRAAALTGRHPTLSRLRFDTTIAAVERELAARGVSAAIGRRYTASGRDNVAQLFSGRFAAHENATVAALARLALAGGVDAAQLELGIPLRWPGPAREALVDGLVAALAQDAPVRPPGGAAAGTSRADWDLPAARERDAPASIEPGWSLQAVLDDDGGVAMFAGVEATGPHSMAARFSIVANDGSMMLLVGEGEWAGEPGRYELEGLCWKADPAGTRIEVSLGATDERAHDGAAAGRPTLARMIRYPTHDAYLDLEQGLAASTLVAADVHLVFDDEGTGYGRLSGHVRAGDVALEVDTVAFVDRGGRRSADPRERLRVAGRRRDGSVFVERSHTRERPTLLFDDHAGGLGTIRAASAPREHGALVEAEVTARLPVWRPVGDGLLVRWTFGIVRCRHQGSDELSSGLFEALELFAGAIAADAPATDES